MAITCVAIPDSCSPNEVLSNEVRSTESAFVDAGSTYAREVLLTKAAPTSQALAAMVVIAMICVPVEAAEEKVEALASGVAWFTPLKATAPTPTFLPVDPHVPSTVKVPAAGKLASSMKKS